MLYNRLFLVCAISFWIACFTVPASAQNPGYQTEFTVAQDGSGDFTRIQEAIDATKAFPDEPITIRLKKGVYKEKVRVYSWNTKLSLIGEDRENTVITYDDYFDKINLGRNSTFHTYTLQVEANDFRLENVTVENTAGPVGQAVALHVEGDRCVFVNCAFKGNQDTVYLAGERSRDYFRNCYIDGTTDFIFGEATAWFEACEIRAKSDSYITAASTVEGRPYGFVFHECDITAAPDVKQVYLGRPWRQFARTVFLECNLQAPIAPEGWKAWSNKDDKQTTFYAEYASQGPGAQPKQRIAWSHQLSKADAAAYTPEKILEGWMPEAAKP
ncbi:pectinesterase [Catalinimonas alkaloidigena]|uniref:Pectinesterase n=1 Tax=Catalinimonas alkaloidigena TaxID=1075417 RepID=A0A1G9PEW8_9BACT|nr:pectinesterase family protein [Catalinimonas alkaloidigena]SDL97330.1 pectinesterase [Catalinimonas alkaloidigena]